MNPYLPAAPGNTTEFARADNRWAVPPGTGGSIVYTWRGAWNTTTAYNQYDTVSRSGSSYVCVSPNTNIDPATDTAGTYWQMMAQHGSRWWNGNADPVSVAGSAVGDYYLNNTSGAVFLLS